MQKRTFPRLILLPFLVAIFTTISSCGGNDTSPDAYIEAVNENYFAKAHLILDKLYARYLSAPAERFIADRYWTAADYIYKAEMQWLLPQNDPEADRRLIFTIDAMNPPGVEPIGDYVYELAEHNKNWERFHAYCTFAEQYNKLCLELIRIALRHNNLPLAELTLDTMKICYTRIKRDDNYIYQPNTADIDRAVEQINRYAANNP